MKVDRLFAQAQRHAPCVVVFPFTAQDYRLAQRMVAVFSPLSGVTVRFPLIERRVTGEDCRRHVVEAWGIPLPAMTAWLGEAVCFPCIRGTLAYYGVSIHAPARGATWILVAAVYRGDVSIHAPARGAT